jgi:mono/diheme cytochrome c family protein
MTIRQVSLLGWSVALGAVACSTVPLGATDADLARARDRTAQGADVYERQCAACHGARGEGLADTPAVMGEGALPIQPRNASPAQQYASDEHAPPDVDTSLASLTRRAFKTARDVHGYLVQHMPKVRQAEPPPSEAEYWAVVSFLIVANGSDIPPSGVDASNADFVTVPR